eukprot:1887210-Rhodomonas_salina.2
MQELGVSHVKGLLLHGPPGCGKTLIAREIGKALRARPPKVVNGPEILDKWVCSPSSFPPNRVFSSTECRASFLFFFFFVFRNCRTVQAQNGARFSAAIAHSESLRLLQALTRAMGGGVQVGEAERNVRALFWDAEREWKEKGDKSALHIIILDELDSVARRRGSLRVSSALDLAASIARLVLGSGCCPSGCCLCLAGLLFCSVLAMTCDSFTGRLFGSARLGREPAARQA